MLSLLGSPLFSELKKGKCEPIDISEGEILKIKPDGNIERNTFKYSYYTGKDWCDYGSYGFSLGSCDSVHTRDDYIEDLKSVALYQGYSPEDIDELLGHGLTLEEIEDYLYEF